MIGWVIDEDALLLCHGLGNFEVDLDRDLGKNRRLRGLKSKIGEVRRARTRGGRLPKGATVMISVVR